MRHCLTTILLIILCVTCTADEKLDFAADVVPILQEHCLRCHSSNNRKGDVSLETVNDLRDGDYLVAGKPEESHLIELIAGVDDEPPEMPKEGKPLSKEQVDVIRQWIDGGADWPEDLVVREKSRADESWWSLQPLTPPEDGRTIDTYIDAVLKREQLQRNPRASRAELIRRATYDLTGLPPTPEEVEHFVNSDDPEAWPKLIDRLLESPHYGERWGRHWLDVVRFGESNGFERNVIYKDAWPFRDYVIRSINEDKPFNTFIREHLAGDVFGKDDPQVAVGTVFLVAGPYDDVGNQDPVQKAQIRANTIDEMIRASGEAFLGLTIGCSRCHDHKFDPIRQEDYYSFYATFSGVSHGSAPLATPRQRADRNAALAPLEKQLSELQTQQKQLSDAIVGRGQNRLAEHQAVWTRPAVDPTGTEDTFDPVAAKFVRLLCEAQDTNPASRSGFGIGEFEVWSAGDNSRNVALASNGGKASGDARIIEDFPGAYGPQLAIDGKTGARFIARGSDLTIELAEVTSINRVFFFSSGKEETRRFRFVAEYRIEVSTDGMSWHTVTSSADRKPIAGDQFQGHRLLLREATSKEQTQLRDLKRKIAAVKARISKVPTLPTAWIGKRSADDAKGPFYIFEGGSPQKKVRQVVPASLSALQNQGAGYRLEAAAAESVRRQALADWIVHPTNPLTPRVLANRLWHYHFGTGIVDTPSDLGYMGGRPTHPALLDYLARRLLDHGWKLKPLHREIMLSRTYQQSSANRPEAAKADADARLLWRFPPRRLSAEEIRDTLLDVAGLLTHRGAKAKGPVPDGGSGFRLYRFMQDNVCTYAPLDKHGPETYRRAVYHQNARASVVDLMTDFDQPDCTFSAPRRAETTTPLQALTMLNHSFTMDVSVALAKRLEKESGPTVRKQIQRACQLCYGRAATVRELKSCEEYATKHGMPSLCRVLLNTSELIYVR